MQDKYFTKKYEIYKSEILTEIRKKYENCGKSKYKTDIKFSIYSKFFEELRDEEFSVKSNLPENKEGQIHVVVKNNNAA